MTSGRISDAATARRFILAGSATFTLVSLRTGNRYTYQARKGDNDGFNAPRFVSLLIGKNNEEDYQYIGLIDAEGRGRHFRLTNASLLPMSAMPVQAIAWAWDHILQGQIPILLQVWHEGRCGRCGRRLTVPESIESGIGPECTKEMPT